jgi:hypothetical protein
MNTLPVVTPCRVSSTLATFRKNINVFSHLYIEEGNNMFFRNVRSQVSDYTVLLSTRPQWNFRHQINFVVLSIEWMNEWMNVRELSLLWWTVQCHIFIFACKRWMQETRYASTVLIRKTKKRRSAREDGAKMEILVPSSYTSCLLSLILCYLVFAFVIFNLVFRIYSILPVIAWRDWGKPCSTYVSIVNVPVEIRTECPRIKVRKCTTWASLLVPNFTCSTAVAYYLLPTKEVTARPRIFPLSLCCYFTLPKK